MSVVPRNNTQGLSLGGLEASLLSLPVLVGVALLSIIGAAAYLPLFDLDEGAFSEATREILASGNWVSTYLNGEPRHDKPILIYWFQASSVLLFGHEPWAYRLPSMLVAVVWVFAVYRFSREFYNERSARLAVWVLAVSLVASSIFKAATADALLNCLINLIFFDIYRYYCKPEQKQLYKIGLYMGLAFLTKGPIGVLLPLMAAFLCFAYLGRLALFFRAVFDPRAWATVLLVITPWHIAVYLDQGMDFFEGFYLGHNLGRYGQTMEGHGGSPLYYVLLLPVLLAPFSVQFFRLFREIKIAKNIDIDKVDALTVYLLTWFGLTLLLFSFSETQLPHYLLYGMTPVFLLVA
ncbi:MAG: glycoside hydrolase, partial [Alteromonadaceae bacterium]